MSSARKIAVWALCTLAALELLNTGVRVWLTAPNSDYFAPTARVIIPLGPVFVIVAAVAISVGVWIGVYFLAHGSIRRGASSTTNGAHRETPPRPRGILATSQQSQSARAISGARAPRLGTNQSVVLGDGEARIQPQAKLRAWYHRS